MKLDLFGGSDVPVSLPGQGPFSPQEMLLLLTFAVPLGPDCRTPALREGTAAAREDRRDLVAPAAAGALRGGAGQAPRPDPSREEESREASGRPEGCPPGPEGPARAGPECTWLVLHLKGPGSLQSAARGSGQVLVEREPKLQPVLFHPNSRNRNRKPAPCGRK